MSANINNQYDFFKKVNLDANGNIGVVFSGATSQPFAFTASDYNELLTLSGMTDGDLAYVVNSQGTQWLPGSLGGNYYPNGIYVYVTGAWQSDRNAIALQLATNEDKLLDNQIIVNQDNFATTIGGTIDSTKEYFLDGVIDMGTTQIIVPSTGLTIRGYNFDASGLVSSEDNYTMFVSASGGSGNILGLDFYIRTSGVNSKVFDIVDATGFNAIELNRVNFIACTSLGVIDSYRQGLENGNGRFAGSPSLELKGNWVGGYRITTSIVRSMSDTTTEPLFKAGSGFTMNSRFLSDMNTDLGDLQPLFDFSPSNFPNPSTLQLKGMELTRGGVYNADDTNITPNVSKSDLCSDWKENNGLPNTYVGGTTTVSTGATTTLTLNTWVDAEGLWNTSNLEHFSGGTDGILAHIGINPREYEVIGNIEIEGSPNRELSIRFRRWDDSAGVFVDLDNTIQTRLVNNLVGGRDLAFFFLDISVILDQYDYLQLQIRNNTDNTDATVEVGSFIRIQER